MKKNNKSQLVYVSKLLKYGKKYTGVVLLSFLCAFISMALTLIGPNKLSELTDEITKGITNKINMQVVVNLGVTSIIIYICSYVMSVLQGWIMASVSRQLSKNLRTDISRKLNRLPMWYYNQTSIGNILSILTNDVGTIGDSINQSIVYLLPSEVLFIGSLWMMFQTNFVLTIASASASFLGFILICCVSKYNQKYFSQQQENLAKMNSRVEEIYNAHILVKAYGGELYEQKKFETLNQSLRESGFKTQIVSGILTAIIHFIDNLSYITVCIVETLLGSVHIK